jgi:hypothetical protein
MRSTDFVTPALKLTLSLLPVFLIPFELQADSIIFRDLDNSGGVTITAPPRAGGPGCGFVPFDPNEDCLVLVLPPASGLHPASGQEMFQAYSEADDPTKVSDSFDWSPNGNFFGTPVFVIHFFSSGPNTDEPCNTVANGCIAAEIGSIQQAFVLDWVNDNGDVVATDTVSFQSGVVPEPASLPWLLLGFLALLIKCRRRIWQL